MAERLSSSQGDLKDNYRTVVVGSGYGGAVTAARLAEHGQPVCLLERGREFPVGTFPDTLGNLAHNVRGSKKPLGMFDYYLMRDIDVLKGCGLGGGSLVNAGVAIRPDPEVFADPRWPRRYRELAASGEIWKYYQKAETMLAAKQHPRGLQLTKVQKIKEVADTLRDGRFGLMNICVNFDVDGRNHVGVEQKPCIDCGDCITGCNVGAKNTLYMNYLPYARQRGAEIFTQIEVRRIAAAPGGGYTVTWRHNRDDRLGEERTLSARNVVLSAGTLGSTEILLRSVRERGLTASSKLGFGFSGNGDYLGLAYNSPQRINVLGYGNHPDSPRAKVKPGPTIVSGIQYDRSQPVGQRLTLQDFTAFPSGLVNTFRHTLGGLAALGTHPHLGVGEWLAKLWRVAKDQVFWTPDGAANHSLVYLVMALDSSCGSMQLGDDDKLTVVWDDVLEDPVYEKAKDALLVHARTLGATFAQLGRPNIWTRKDNLVTAHPLGGCHVGDDADRGVVDTAGRVFDGQGGVHHGLYVVDGSLVPMALGVNPLNTISALAEHIVEGMLAALR